MTEDQIEEIRARYGAALSSSPYPPARDVARLLEEVCRLRGVIEGMQPILAEADYVGHDADVIVAVIRDRIMGEPDGPAREEVPRVLYVSLHGHRPVVYGPQTDNEVAYPGYSRQPLPPDGLAVTFRRGPGTDPVSVNYFAIGPAAEGPGYVEFCRPLDRPIPPTWDELKLAPNFKR